MKPQAKHLDSCIEGRQVFLEMLPFYNSFQKRVTFLFPGMVSSDFPMRLLDAVFFPCLLAKPKKSVLRDLRFDLFDNLSKFHLRLCLEAQTNGNPLGIRAEA